jgi:hypothetical protein
VLLVGLLKLLNRLSLLLNKRLRPPKELRLLPVDPKPAALRLLLSKHKRLPKELLPLLVKLVKLLLRQLRLNVCKYNQRM